MVSGGETQEKTPAPEKKSAAQTPAPTSSADKKILVVYFSRTGEEYNVGNITKGNTEIVAEYIAQKIGADTFEIKPAKPYPDTYEPCTEIAKRSSNQTRAPLRKKY